MNDSIEKIVVGLKNDYKSGAYGNLRDGIFIQEIPYYFKDLLIFDDKATIRVPIVFKDISQEVAAIKYPSEDRPQIIKESPDGKIDICLSIFQDKLFLEEIETRAKVIKEMYLKSHMVEQFIVEANGKNETNYFSWFTFLKDTFDGSIYVHMFVTSVNDQMVLGMLNCPGREAYLWKLAMKEIMLSLQTIKE